METVSLTMKNLSEYGMHTWGKGRKRVMGPLSMVRSKHQIQYKECSSLPTEVEKGLRPKDYSPFDHARFTMVFSPVRMPRLRFAPCLPFPHFFKFCTNCYAMKSQLFPHQSHYYATVPVHQTPASTSSSK